MKQAIGQSFAYHSITITEGVLTLINKSLDEKQQEEMRQLFEKRNIVVKKTYVLTPEEREAQKQELMK